MRWIAPILAFTADEIWQYLPGERNESVMLNGWYQGLSELPEGTEMVRPGENLKFEVELIAPIAMEEKLRFAIREGGRTVGAGVVSKIIA